MSEEIILNPDLVSNIQVEADTSQYPEFEDAYISSADYDGVAMTDEQLEILNDMDYDYSVFEALMDKHSGL